MLIYPVTIKEKGIAYNELVNMVIMNKMLSIAILPNNA